MTGTEADQPLAAPVELVLPTAADTEALGRRLAGRLRAGDLVLLSGELGAGKTTLARGLGAGLGVRGDVTSPTFVIARVGRRWCTSTPTGSVTWPRSTTSTSTRRCPSR
jgi:ATPase subunit of ABC transporter with duplicated ATPase domains